MTKTFDLITEPWIITLDDRDQPRLLGIREVFHQAGGLSRVEGEIPTQAAAVMRLLLAVLWRAMAPALPDDPTEDDALEWWQETWQQGLPLELIDAYLDKWRDRFDLLDPEAPFMQTVGIESTSGAGSGLRKLIAEVPDGAQYFTTRAGQDIERLRLPEAARWLVHTQAFDTAGIKTGMKGDHRVKAGKLYGNRVAWSGNCGLILAVGANLAQSLLLNTVATAIRPNDLPAWERPVAKLLPDFGRRPSGPVDLMTWQSRRVRLVRDSDGDVVDVMLTGGDDLDSANQFAEQHTAWRFSPTQTKKKGAETFYPLPHSPAKRVWQGLTPMLSGAQSDPRDKSGRSTRRPAEIVEWLATLMLNQCVDPSMIIELETFGLEYGQQSALIIGSAHDRLAATIRTLTDQRAVALVIAQAATAQEAVLALANLRSNLVRAAGGEDSGQSRDRVFEQGYSALDSPFRHWLATLDADQLDAERVRWHATCREAIARVGAEIVSEAGPAALTGRWIKTGANAEQMLMDAARADMFFRNALQKATPMVPKPNQVPTRKEKA